MKIALIKETKIPVDNRVALSPMQAAELNKRYPQHQIVVQRSAIRCFSDEEYAAAGVELVDSVADCDVLFGIKEAQLGSLVEGKHYFYFGHVAKMQAYNRPLLKGMMQKGVTFSDYEYLTDECHQRVCAFGWWAGVVGVYYTLRGWGLRTGAYSLPEPDRRFTLEQLKANLKAVDLPKVKVLVTGAGRVSQGAQYILGEIGAQLWDTDRFMHQQGCDTLSYAVADVDQLVVRKTDGCFEMEDFMAHPQTYESDFYRWAISADILLCGHFWSPEAPVYLDEELLGSADLRIRMIGDVTCDIMGSIRSTLRSSTHDAPYYDYDRKTRGEAAPFSGDDHITVMAVDTCPNALAMDTSAYFGQMLTEHVIVPLLEGRKSDVIERSTILRQGKLTESFEYLQDFVGRCSRNRAK